MIDRPWLKACACLINPSGIQKGIHYMADPSIFPKDFEEVTKKPEEELLKKIEPEKIEPDKIDF
jgi:hypothetical protein